MPLHPLTQPVRKSVRYENVKLAYTEQLQKDGRKEPVKKDELFFNSSLGRCVAINDEKGENRKRVGTRNEFTLVRVVSQLGKNRLSQGAE